MAIVEISASHSLQTTLIKSSPGLHLADCRCWVALVDDSLLQRASGKPKANGLHDLDPGQEDHEKRLQPE